MASSRNIIVAGAGIVPLLAAQNGAALVIINREATEQDEYANLVVHDEIGPTLAAAVPVHLALSLGWAAVLAATLPRGWEPVAGAVAVAVAAGGASGPGKRGRRSGQPHPGFSRSNLRRLVERREAQRFGGEVSQTSRSPPARASGDRKSAPRRRLSCGRIPENPQAHAS